MEVRYGRQYSSYGVLAREISVADKIMAAPVAVRGNVNDHENRPYL